MSHTLPDWAARLGTVSDNRLAQELGIPRTSVSALRKALGIEAHGSDGRPLSNCWKDPKNVARLGKVSDSQLGRELGITDTAVRKARENRGIPAYQPASAPRDTWADPCRAALLGHLPDAEVARQCGVSPATVAAARWRSRTRKAWSPRVRC